MQRFKEPQFDRHCSMATCAKRQATINNERLVLAAGTAIQARKGRGGFSG